MASQYYHVISDKAENNNDKMMERIIFFCYYAKLENHCDLESVINNINTVYFKRNTKFKRKDFVPIVTSIMCILVKRKGRETRLVSSRLVSSKDLSSRRIYLTLPFRAGIVDPLDGWKNGCAVHYGARVLSLKKKRKKKERNYLTFSRSYCPL